MNIGLAVGIMSVILLAGCATTGSETAVKPKQRTKAYVDALEKQIQEKDRTIQDLEAQLDKVSEEKNYSIKIAPEAPAKTKSRQTLAQYNPESIQRALKNAGYYSGAIDGKIGKMTKSALKSFQKDNGLIVDGIVGKRTWEKLNEHLS